MINNNDDKYHHLIQLRAVTSLRETLGMKNGEEENLTRRKKENLDENLNHLHVTEKRNARLLFHH